MRIPSNDDWINPNNDLDINWAKKHFLGVTYERALEMFRENSCLYQEDLMFMPVQCFSFYIEPFMDYLLSEESDIDDRNNFVNLIDYRKEELINLSTETKDRISKVFVATEQIKFRSL